jgi:hypothetical protein
MPMRESTAPYRRILTKTLTFFAVVACVAFFTGVAAACPTCKESLAHDPAAANLARGFYYSILFMVSMPFVIFGSMSAYFYWEVRKAKARQAAELAKSDSARPELAL